MSALHTHLQSTVMFANVRWERPRWAPVCDRTRWYELTTTHPDYVNCPACIAILKADPGIATRWRCPPRGHSKRDKAAI